MCPAYRATLLYICFVMLAVVRDERNESVEVFVRLRVNLQFLKGKIAGKRACLRSIRFLGSLFSIIVSNV